MMKLNLLIPASLLQYFTASAAPQNCINVNSWSDFSAAIATTTANSILLFCPFDIDADENSGVDISIDGLRIFCDKKTGSAGSFVQSRHQRSRLLQDSSAYVEKYAISEEDGPKCSIRGPSRHLNIYSNDVTIMGFDFYESDQSAIHIAEGVMNTHLLHSSFVSNTRDASSEEGAGAAVNIAANVKQTSIVHCEFTENFSQNGDGGAINISDGYSGTNQSNLIVYRSFFVENHTKNGAGAAINGGLSSSTIFSRSEFFQNTVEIGDGPAVSDSSNEACDGGENKACLNEDIDNNTFCDGIFRSNGECDSFSSACDLPSASPTGKPTNRPSSSPTIHASLKPTHSPTSPPTMKPSPTPSAVPSRSPTATPSLSPTVSHSPTEFPTVTPSCVPSFSPTNYPTTTPSLSHEPTYIKIKVPTQYAAPRSKPPTHKSHEDGHTHSSEDNPDPSTPASKHNHTHTSHESHKHQHNSHTHSLHEGSEHTSKTHSHTSKIHSHVQVAASQHQDKTHTHTSKFNKAAETGATKESKHDHDYHTHGSKISSDEEATPVNMSNDRVLQDEGYDAYEHTHTNHQNSNHDHGNHSHKSKYLNVDKQGVDKCAGEVQVPQTRRVKEWEGTRMLRRRIHW